MDATEQAAGAPAAAQLPAFLIEAAFAARIYLADYQNAVPVLRELSVTNHTEAAVPRLGLSLESVLPVLTPRTRRLDALGAKQQYRVTDLGIALDGAALAQLPGFEPATDDLSISLADPREEVANLRESASPEATSETLAMMTRQRFSGNFSPTSGCDGVWVETEHACCATRRAHSCACSPQRPSSTERYS